MYTITIFFIRLIVAMPVKSSETKEAKHKNKPYLRIIYQHEENDVEELKRLIENQKSDDHLNYTYSTTYSSDSSDNDTLETTRIKSLNLKKKLVKHVVYSDNKNDSEDSSVFYNNSKPIKYHKKDNLHQLSPSQNTNIQKTKESNTEKEFDLQVDKKYIDEIFTLSKNDILYIYKKKIEFYENQSLCIKKDTNMQNNSIQNHKNDNECTSYPLLYETSIKNVFYTINDDFVYDTGYDKYYILYSEGNQIFMTKKFEYLFRTRNDKIVLLSNDLKKKIKIFDSEKDLIIKIKNSS
ncbi:hypothetical protein GVAV_002003 [Gurleya vavrai]